MPSDDDNFDQLIARVRAGDGPAAAELVRQYEPEIRREVRIWLTDPRLRRIVDSLDICQSVFGAFFVRAALGQFDMVDPNHLFRLLAKMAKNKVIDQHRSETVRRNTLQNVDASQRFADSGEPVDTDSDPETIVAGEELLVRAQSQLSPNEKQISRLRAAGHTWDEIGQEMGTSGQGLRKKFERACDRIIENLELQ